MARPSVASVLRFRVAAAVVAGASAGCAVAPAPPAQPAAASAPTPHRCPDGVANDTRCWRARDAAGAHVLIAMPAHWNRKLVVHAHGGPLLGAPNAERVDEDLQRWSLMTRLGYAWIGTSYAQGGVAVRSAAADLHRLRPIFDAAFGAPVRTILHGQSWGASVAARAAEAPQRHFDGVLLTSGVLGGGSRSYDFRLDLRVAWQALCSNFPAPDEAPYPLWQGLPEGSPITRADLARRGRECLGLGLAAGERTPQQAQRLALLLQAVRIPESSILGHMAWATWHFQDIARRSGGANVFSNVGVPYPAPIDARALRYAADPGARRAFADDTDPTGRIPLPVVSVHGIDDPIAFVELEHAFAQTMADAGRGDALVQAFTRHATHSYLDDATYRAALAALEAWLDAGPRPDAASIAARCAAQQAPAEPPCRFDPGYRPPPLASRVAPRAP